VVPLRLPPLRERIEDLPDLIRHFFSLAEKDGLPPKKAGYAGAGPPQAAPLARQRPRTRKPGAPARGALSAGRHHRFSDRRRVGAAGRASNGSAPLGVDNLGGAVEAYLSSHFSGSRTASRRRGSTTASSRKSRCRCSRPPWRRRAATRFAPPTCSALNRNTLRKKIRDLDIQVYRSGG